MALKTHREYIKELEKEQEKNKNKKKTLKTHQEYIKEIGFVYDPKLSSKNRRISEIKKENQEKNTWFNKNAQGTTGQKIAATTGDIGLNLIRGVIDAGDFIGDLGSYGVAGVADLLGFDNYAKDVREGAQIRLSNALLKPIDDNIDKYSVLGEKSDSVISSVGQSYAGGKVGQAFLPNAGNIPIGKLNMPVTAVATGASSSITEAYKNGANDKQAFVKGVTGGLIEGFSEGIFGVFGQGGSELEDMVTRTLTKKIENQVLRKIAKTGISALGEGLEEQISYTLNWIADNGQDVVFEALGMTPENKMGKEWSWQEFGESGLSGALAGGLGAGATNIGMNKTQNQIEQAIHDTQNNLGRTLTRQEQGIVSNNVASGNQIDSKKLADAIKTDEEVVKALVKERQKESKGKSYQEIRKEVIKDLEQGDIDINKINEIIGGKDYQTFQQYAQEIDELANRRKELKKVLDNAKEGSLEYKNAKVEYDSLQEQINNYDAKTLKGNLQNLINDKVLQNGLISNSYRENAKRSVKFEADLSKYNDKEKAIVQKAIDSGVLNNTRRTHILVDMVAKLASDKGVDFDFTNNKNLEDSGFAIKGKVIDGYVTGNNIALNVESPKALNKIVGHEITHVLEGTELYDQLKTAIEKYAELKGEYKTRLEETTKRYENVKDADVEKEVVADLVGDYIFNDPKFVQQLSTEQPSLFKKIFNEIKYLCKVVTAGSQEAKQLEKVKKIFEDVYRENSKVANDTQTNINVKFDIELLEKYNGKNYNRANNRQVSSREYANIVSELRSNSNFEPGLSIVDLSKEGSFLIYAKSADKFKIMEVLEKGKKVYEADNVAKRNSKRNAKTQFQGTNSSVGYTTIESGRRAKNNADILRMLEKIQNIRQEHNIDGIENIEPYLEQETIDYYIELFENMEKDNQELDNSSFSFEQKTAPLIKAAKKNTKYSISENNKYPDWIENMSYGEPYYKWQNYIIDLMAKKQNETGIRIYKINDEVKTMKNNDFRTIQKIEYEDTKDLAKKIYDIQAVDNEGRTLTKEQVSFFKDSKVRDKEGNLLVMYHGTKADFSVFDKKLSPNGFFFATKQRKNSVAGYYAEEDGNIKEVYLDIKKPLYDYRPHGNQLKQAIENGTINNYDGVIAIASEDFGERKFYNYETQKLDYEQLKKGDIVEVIVFNPNQIKNVDNTNPTKSDDIRYSISEDNQGRTLSKEQQNYFKNSKLRNEKGQLEIVYHSTPNEFTVFDNDMLGENTGYDNTLFGSFVTTNKAFSERFKDIDNEGKKGKTMELYANVKKPITHPYKAGVKYGDEQASKIVEEYYNAIGEDGALEEMQMMIEDGDASNLYDAYMNIVFGSSESPFEYADSEREMLEEAGYDAVEFVEGYESELVEGSKSDEVVSSYAIFNSNQLKNTDNTKPTKKPDIRYSISDAGTHGTLMAIHNLSEEQFKGILELGGFPVPSIAITNPNIYPHENFGNISVLFNKETINPLNKLNEVYPSDIYSTRFPDTTRKINTETIENIVKDGYDYGISMSLQRLESLLDDGHFDIDWVPEELMQYYFAINGIEYTEENRNLYEYGEKRSDYIEWLDEIKDASIGETRVIRPDVDLFTPSGNRRTLDQRSLPYTLENIVKIMTKKRTRGSEDIHYVRPGLIRGNLATKFKSIEDIKKNQNKLITYEEMETLKKEVDNKFYSILDELEKYHRNPNHWLTRDSVAIAINETAKSKVINESVLKTKLEENYIENVPKESLTKVIDFLNELKYAPTEYFEAKPQRAVGLDEVQAIVLPNYTSTKLKQQLQEAGLRYYEYDPNIKGDRQRVINQFDDLKFSLSNSNERTTRTPGDIYGSDIKIQQVASIIRKVQRGQALNPNEISKLTPEDANTTPILPKVDRNKVGDGDSRFAKNIKNKTKMLSEEHREMLANEEEIAYYDKVTNKESLEEAYKRLENGSFETTKWFSKASENATAVDVAEGWILLKQYADNNDTDGMVEVAKKLRDMGTKAGQTVQAFNIMSRLTPEGMVKYAQSELMEAYEKMVQGQTKKWIDENKNNFDLQPDEVKFIMDTMKEVSMMEDGYDKRVKLAQIQKLMTDKLPPAKGAGIKSWMRISMLFNPKTQVRNVAGNAIIAPVNYFGDMFASAIDKQIAKKTGVRTTGRTKVGNYAKGFKEGLYQSYNDFKLGINTRNLEGNRFEIGEGRSFKDKGLGKALNKVDSLLSFMLDAGDRGFYEAAFTNSINNQMVLNNTNEVTQEMIDIATQEALSRTWQDNNGYTKFVLNVRKGLNQINVRGYGLGDILIPFAKTPANLTKAIVDYSPVGLVTTMLDGVKLKNAIETGQYTPQMQHEFVQNLGKATAGTMLYVLGVALAKAGITSGESDEDKDVANFLKNTLGVSSYSIKIGDKTFTYDWAQPVAAPLTITANIVNAKDNKEMALLEAVVGSMDSAGSTLLEQSFLQSINDVLNNTDGVVSGLITEVLELPSRAIPTLSKQIVDLTDNTQRQTFEKGQPVQSAINAAKAKIPGLSQKLSPQVDTLGREIQRYGGKNNAFNVFFNPANVNTENISEAAQEIYNVYKATNDKSVMPRVADYAYQNKNGVTIPLTTKQRAELQKASGQIVEDSITNLLNDPNYQSLSDTDKASIINDIVNYAYNKAKSKVLGTEMSKTYNKIEEYVANGGTANDYYMNKKEIDYSLNYPEKYSTITLITSYDNYLNYQDEIDMIIDSYSETEHRKNAVISYVNGLDLSIPQKAMLIKLNYKSFTAYDNVIIQYINNQNLGINEKNAILKKLGLK